jgi:Rieske Fe-S protein
MKKQKERESEELQKRLLTRRGFCSGMLLSSAALVASRRAVANEDSAQSRVVAYPPMKIQGASELRPGNALLFNYPRINNPAILARTDDGSYYAYTRKCSHLGCALHFSRSFNRLDCPCHRGSFDVKSGFVVDGPPRRPLDEIILQIRGAEVWAVGRRTEIDNPVCARVS